MEFQKIISEIKKLRIMLLIGIIRNVEKEIREIKRKSKYYVVKAIMLSKF